MSYSEAKFQSAPMPNNGMHPTADTAALMYTESLGAAGDAGRYALLTTY
ncbi:MAG: hypothetical protein M3362_11120 [Acidobacteriota bacterium]|nr:hypothetical protein [Acidobacteriota bacterium]